MKLWMRSTDDVAYNLSTSLPGLGSYIVNIEVEKVFEVSILDRKEFHFNIRLRLTRAFLNSTMI